MDIRLHNNLINWLARNGFSNCDVDEGDVFSYDREDHVILCGPEEPEELGLWYAQYMYELGCENAPFLWSVTLAFLHEACHHITIDNFNETELMVYAFVKECIDCAGDYWDTPDEFAANVAVVDFIEKHFDAVLELQDILYDGYF